MVADTDDIDPETFGEAVVLVAATGLQGEGEELARRGEVFERVVDHIREQGVSSRAEIMAELCPADNCGYSAPEHWYKHAVSPGLAKLEELTDELERPHGEIRYREL